jgi:hypothetical protein
MMLYVYTDLETSLKRNQERFEKSGGEDRSLLPGAVLSTWKGVTQNFNDYQDLFGSNFISVANTGEDETMKDIENILKTYVDPFKVKDGREKTEKELARSKASKSKTKPRSTRYFTIRSNPKYYKFFYIKRRSTK